jgi:large subunit ribosomal protein L17
MMRSMVTSLFDSERITTTAPKAKELRRVAERLITRAKKGYRAHQEGAQGAALAHWREAGRFVRKPDVLRKLFDRLAPLYLERNGGYTRIIRLDHTRVGDNARLVLLELVDSEASKSPLMRGAKPEAAEAEGGEKKPAKGRGKSKEKAEAAEAEPSREKKPKREKAGKVAMPAKGKAEAKKQDSGRGKAGQKSRSKRGE